MRGFSGLEAAIGSRRLGGFAASSVSAHGHAQCFDLSDRGREALRAGCRDMQAFAAALVTGPAPAILKKRSTNLVLLHMIAISELNVVVCRIVARPQPFPRVP
ncbi:hypothetical protein AM571_CH01907 [Rhizobium etli 8C-3]|uniref:Uncharacterized protein n=1 Tax=Rhizobium etli 8C-3 TaxID=538025 RepID=A0A1L5P3Q3_RHIET|nr:hypothetical protein AM571_CH01907 [Rhizobium etli 8C-3]